MVAGFWKDIFLTTCILRSYFVVAGRPESRDIQATEIRKAHVICIVYAIDEPASFNRIGVHWLPYIRSLGVNVGH